MGKPSARPSRTASRWQLRLGIGNRKRMPENHSLPVARGTLREKAECLGAVRRVEREAVLRREPGGPLSLQCRVTVALPQPLHDVEGAGSGERYPPVREQVPGRASESHGTPTIGDQPRCHADAHDPRRPAERGDGEAEPRGGREAVTRAGAAQRDEYRPGRGAREQELERAYLIPSVARG